MDFCTIFFSFWFISGQQHHFQELNCVSRFFSSIHPSVLPSCCAISTFLCPCETRGPDFCPHPLPCLDGWVLASSGRGLIASSGGAAISQRPGSPTVASAAFMLVEFQVATATPASPLRCSRLPERLRCSPESRAQLGRSRATAADLLSAVFSGTMKNSRAITVFFFSEFSFVLLWKHKFLFGFWRKQTHSLAGETSFGS